MKKVLSVSLVLGLLVVMAGCAENKTRIAEGAGIGGALGALAGGIIGHQSGHGVEGALIGAAAGGTGGALVGAQIEKKPAYDPREPEPTENVTMDKVVAWTKNGDSSDDIIARIKASHAKFSLTQEDLDYLRKNGVSQRVIDNMQEAK